MHMVYVYKNLKKEKFYERVLHTCECEIWTENNPNVDVLMFYLYTNKSWICIMLCSKIFHSITTLLFCAQTPKPYTQKQYHLLFSRFYCTPKFYFLFRDVMLSYIKLWIYFFNASVLLHLLHIEAWKITLYTHCLLRYFHLRILRWMNILNGFISALVREKQE